MAAVLQKPVAGTLTPPRSSHGGERGHWDFSVPITGEESQGFSNPRDYMTDEDSWKHSVPRQTLTGLPNGVSKHPPKLGEPFEPTRSGRSGPSLDHGYLATDHGLSHKKQSNASHSGTDSDSLLDLYGKNGHNGGTMSRKASEKNARSVPESEESYWIHRDKLAQIESKELEEAGFKVGRMSRPGSRSGSRSAGSSLGKRERSRSSHADRTNGDGYSSRAEETRRRIPSPIAVEEDYEHEHNPVSFDIRRPEEVAEQDLERIRSRAIPPRPGTSRIPVPKASPLPLSPTYVDRDASASRSRANSEAWAGLSGEGVQVSKTRPRSASVGSQVISDGEDNTPPRSTRATSASASPTKSKTPSKTPPTSGARKTGGKRNVSQPKPRATSGSSPSKRPGTSGGSSRPVTSHRPEGEAPWIATMYKPDPRLPPDQQIIPTHAKKLAQEQWEQEGKTGSVYDRDFKLLNTEAFEKPADRRSKDVHPPEPEPQEIQEKPKQWPLPSPRPDSYQSGTGEHGGYKITPKIGPAKSPQIPQNQFTSPAPPITKAPRPSDTIRIQEPPVERAEKKGCGCIVM